MYFDDKAKDWDKDIKKHERAEVFASEINEFIKPNGKLNALEFGCGTGLLSFRLKDAFKSITLVDHSEGMISVLKDKIEAQGITNFIPAKIDLFDHDKDFGKIDVIYTLMTLHHMHDLDKTLKEFNSILESGGYLCIADLEKEDGTFHSKHDGFDGHNGFHKEELENLLHENNFMPVYYNQSFVINKKFEGKIKEYPLFLMIAKKD